MEVLINNARVRDLIEDPAQTQHIQQSIEEGSAAWGMQSFDQSLMELLNKDLISYEEALLHSARPEDFRIKYEGFTAMDGKKWSDTGLYDKKVDDKWQNVTEVEIIIPTEIKAIQNEDDKEADKKQIGRAAGGSGRKK